MIIDVIYVVLALAGVLFALRVLRGPTLSERVIGVDGMLVTFMAGIIVNAADTGRGSYLPVAVVLALVSFISTSVVARFVEGAVRDR
ncbi:MAG: monovalent cation/H+ antiporter complex subunit F [Desertimonas sp.]